MVTVVNTVALPQAATNRQTSTVCEPSTAANKKQLMVTGNWFASTSVNGGGVWGFVNPYNRFPATVGGFCCDQVVLYNPRNRIWIWLLQYRSTSAGDNIFRLAVCPATSFGNWHYWDFAPTNLNSSWKKLWFDYPDMAFTDEHLFVTFNMFLDETWQRAAVFRFRLVDLLNTANNLTYRSWTTNRNGSIRLCRGAGSVMYMASHNSLSQLRLFQWADNAANIAWSDINVTPWRAGPYIAPTPNGVNWLGRLDQRITGAWFGAGTIGFMWCAGSDSKHPMPFVRVVRVNASTKAVIDEPDIFSTKAAWAYPAAAANSIGKPGITAFYGGGTARIRHVVGTEAPAGWNTKTTKTSTHDPDDPAWGDYLNCTAHHDQAVQWVASGYTLQGGSTRTDVEPLHVQFR